MFLCLLWVILSLVNGAPACKISLSVASTLCGLVLMFFAVLLFGQIAVQSYSRSDISVANIDIEATIK